MVLLAATALLLAFRSIDLVKTGALLHEVGPRALLILIPYGLAICVDTWAFTGLLRAKGASVPVLRVIPVRLASEAVFNSMAGGTVVAESLVPWILDQRQGIPLATSIASGATRKRLFILANGIYLAIGGIVGFQALDAASQALTHTHLLPWLLGAAAVALISVGIGVGVIFDRGRLADRIRRLLGLIPIRAVRAWIDRHSHRFLEADAELQKSGRTPWSVLLAPLGAYLVIWGTELSETVLILRLLGVELEIQAVFPMEMSTALVRSLAFFVPSGLGVQDVGYAAFLGAFGVPDAINVAFAFVILKRAKEIVYVSVGYLALYFTSKNKSAP